MMANDSRQTTNSVLEQACQKMEGAVRDYIRNTKIPRNMDVPWRDVCCAYPREFVVENETELKAAFERGVSAGLNDSHVPK